MIKRDALRSLRKIVAGLYPDRAEGERVAEDAGLDKRYITFSDKAIQNWDAILKAAVERARLEALVAVVLDEYDNHAALAQAYQDYLNADPDPDVSESGGHGPDTGKYNVSIGHASGVVIGDHSQVQQTLPGDSGAAAPREPRFTYTEQNRRAALETQLALYRRNLDLLQGKKAVYAAGEEPLSLLNQIDQVMRELERLEAELAQLPPA